ncbi:hypothetical protein [Anatilimnocola floriformis]|uniref:hypothetical protein n=1 Tax=Anatilimnocola floriformis TaxID=2948575 RepID=UPI0020C25891|nr:hypothetical protein [Anatilimnocola floriformis]
MLPNLPNGHLYQWITTCGTLLAVASAIGIWSNSAYFNRSLRENVGNLLRAQQQEGLEKEFWEKHLAAESRNAYFAMFSCAVFTFAGLLIAAIGGYFWYTKVQKFEDEQRAREAIRLTHEVDQITGKKELHLP